MKPSPPKLPTVFRNWAFQKLNSIPKVEPLLLGILWAVQVFNLFTLGSRQIATLLPELLRQNKRYGVVSMCIGTGMGAAALI